VEGDVFGPSGLVSVKVYEMLRTLTPLESTSSGHEDKITSAQQPQHSYSNQKILYISHIDSLKHNFGLKFNPKILSVTIARQQQTRKKTENTYTGM